MFYALSDNKIVSLLKSDSNILISFIAKNNFEKGLLLLRGQNAPACKNSDIIVVEEMMSESMNDSLMRIEEESYTEDNAVTSENSSQNSTNLINYPQNDVYQFLNSTLEGQIILGRYLYSKHLDYHRLKEHLIMHYIKQDPVTYK